MAYVFRFSKAQEVQSEWATVAGKPIPVRAVSMEGWRYHFNARYQAKKDSISIEPFNSPSRLTYADQFTPEHFEAKRRQYAREKKQALEEEKKQREKAQIA